MMQEFKNPFFSKRILGWIFVAVSMVMPKYGIDMPITEEQFTVLADQALFTLGMALNLYGGIVAKGPIGFKK